MNICERCGSEVNKAQLAKPNRINKHKTKPHPNDEFIAVDGRTYLKGKSPFEGVWHGTHVPYDILEVKPRNETNFKIKKVLYKSLTMMKTVKCKVRLSKVSSNGWNEVLPICDHFIHYLKHNIYIYIYISRPRGDRKFGGCCFLLVAWAAISVSQF